MKPRVKKVCVCGLVMALYVAVMYFIQPFAFLVAQSRLATGLYSLSYIFPFLIVPLGLANALSNFLLGMPITGIADVVGGFIAGIVTSGLVYLVKRCRLSDLLIIPIISLGPGLIVSVWLSGITGTPYRVLASILCLGQIPPAVLGYLLVKMLGKINTAEFLWGRDINGE